jgi:hypothetical protein
MSRVFAWEFAFFEVIERYRMEPFDWNRSNCITMAIDVVRALRGADCQLPEIPAFNSEKSASSALVLMGAETLGDAIARHFEECPVAMASRGDIGVIDQATLVCVGTRWFSRTAAGSAFVEPSKVQMAFKV